MSRLDVVDLAADSRFTLLCSVGFAVLAFFVLILVHELIHGARYRRFVATDVRYGFAPRKGYARNNA